MIFLSSLSQPIRKRSQAGTTPRPWH
uniref:Uncharacterized protein n=1 Tax=Rhizophora mucronata TaxID=61149 RepID=A0A2P2JIS5_RHIMU